MGVLRRREGRRANIFVTHSHKHHPEIILNFGDPEIQIRIQDPIIMFEVRRDVSLSPTNIWDVRRFSII